MTFERVVSMRRGAAQRGERAERIETLPKPALELLQVHGIGG